MDIKTDLLSSVIGEAVKRYISSWDPDTEMLVKQMPDTAAISALGEIQEVLGKNELEDFEKIDEIVEIFIKYNLDIKGCHDF